MELLTAENLIPYLRTKGYVDASADVTVNRLAGGVSNEVFYVAVADHRDFVFKQAREQLRVPDPWFSGVERIWREVEVLRICQELLEDDEQTDAPDAIAQTPRILFEDRDNFAFAMTAAPPNHTVWKSELLAGSADAEIARRCGRLLGRLHARSWHNQDVAQRLEDREFFDQLRIDPYYRKVAKIHPDLAPLLEQLIDSVWTERHSLVHADFSPKNLLVYAGGLLMVDFETGHYGDPAFDLGFFLSHLTLKSFFHASDHERFLALIEGFWAGYRQELADGVSDSDWTRLIARGLLNLGGCLLARLDGKSQVEYLTDPGKREAVRQVSRRLLREPCRNWGEALDLLRDSLTAVGTE